MNERYFVCEHCKKLITETEILSECEEGQTGMCDCHFINYEWDSKYDCYEPVHLRIYHPYIEITKKAFDELSRFSQVERLTCVESLPEKEYKLKRKLEKESENK